MSFKSCFSLDDKEFLVVDLVIESLEFLFSKYLSGVYRVFGVYREYSVE